MLSDFFLASAEQLRSLDVRSGPHGSLPAVTAKGFDPIELRRLESRLRDLPEGAVEQTIVREEDDSAVIALGTNFRDALAALDQAALRDYAEEWLLTDGELEILSEVSELARQAGQDGTHLYVWIAP